MPTVSPRILRAFAAALETSFGRRATRRVLIAGAERSVPVVLVEWMASREPAARGMARASPIVTPCDARPTSTGPLDGDSLVVKDALDVGGAPTGLGLASGEIATDDAELVARARAAGGDVTGKSLMTELGMDGVGALVPHAMPENPRVAGHFAGGSSIGTAVAVSSGLVRYGIGGDGLGSVRIPAAYTGLVGLKPGQDRLSSRGYRSVAASMDVPGPMARDVADCARLFQVLAGEKVEPIRSHVPARVGIVRGLGPELATRDIAHAFRRALDAMETELVSVDVPGAPHNAILGMVAATLELAESPFSRGKLSGQGALNVAMGRSFRSGDRARIDARRASLRDAVLRAIDRTGFLAMPTTAVPAPAIRPRLLSGAVDGLLLRAIGAYTPLANCTGLPAIAVPCGVDARGRPLSIMFVGGPGSELELLRVALAVEETGLGGVPAIG
jgi:Asp-tRNA(Asn)/Glu-tRNA(Gln) amidotransferase A subunit family amidase